jgi:DNA-binding transcriptional MerR regulator
MDLSEPKKLYYSISEVAEITGVKPHILRFWEKDFSMLRPRKNRGGNRCYRERDIRVVLAIKRLLYEEKYTIKGASDQLRRDRSLIDEMALETGPEVEEGPVSGAFSPASPPPLSSSETGPPLNPAQMRDLLQDLRRDLTGLLELIDGKP